MDTFPLKSVDFLLIQNKKTRYNWEVGNRFKLNDRFEFPEEFDMQPFTGDIFRKLMMNFDTKQDDFYIKMMNFVSNHPAAGLRVLDGMSPQVRLLH